MARRPQSGQLGLFRPTSEWRRPAELPDLRGRPLVAIDTELRDDGLGSSRGPGWPMDMGMLCGVSWAAEGSAGYAPTAHPDSDCFDQGQVLRWVDDLFRSGTRIVFHNAPYDIGWLTALGASVPTDFVDTMAACVMADETHRTYNLDDCAHRAGIPGKDIELLREATSAYGGVNSKNPQADIYLVPARYAGPYAEADAVATLGVWSHIEPQLRAQELNDAFRTEMDLIPMVIAMRRRGIRVNQSRAVRTAAEFRAQSAAHLKIVGEEMELRRAATIDEIRSPGVMERWCQQLGISYPTTSGGSTGRSRGSFSKDWMEKHPHPFCQAVSAAKRYEEAATKFVENYLLSFLHKGRIHAEIHQFLSDDGGTRSHRFSYSNPPLQQAPSPDKDPRQDLPHEEDDDPKDWRGKGPVAEDTAIGTKLRRCLEPEKGERWCASDYSQQEPRMTVHFAAVCRVAGVQEALARYRADPRTDYHTMVADMTGLPRSRSKILNLAMTYGKGEWSTAEELGVSIEEARELLENYHSRLPFIKPLEDICRRRASDRGFIRLIDGARMHYTQWEGGFMRPEERVAAIREGHRLTPCSLEEAQERQKNPDHPWHKTRLRRADTRKALNNLIQGSAARQTKRAMLEMWRQGIVPLIQMHDEVGNSVSSPEQVETIARIMIETTPIMVPIIVDSEVGPTWGDAKLSWDECDKKYGRLAA